MPARPAAARTTIPRAVGAQESAAATEVAARDRPARRLPLLMVTTHDKAAVPAPPERLQYRNVFRPSCLTLPCHSFKQSSGLYPFAGLLSPQLFFWGSFCHFRELLWQIGRAHV